MIKTALLAGLIGLSFAVSAVLPAGSAQAFQRANASGPEVPFPLSALIPFPWASVEGVWKVAGDETCGFYRFHVQSDNYGQRVLSVVQLDPVSKQVIAEGAGFEDVNIKMVRAVMHGQQGTYMLIVRAFQTSSRSQHNPKTAMVVSIHPMDAAYSPSETSPAGEVHFILRRKTDPACD